MSASPSTGEMLVRGGGLGLADMAATTDLFLLVDGMVTSEVKDGEVPK